jgi:hypothetical protein
MTTRYLISRITTVDGEQTTYAHQAFASANVYPSLDQTIWPTDQTQPYALARFDGDDLSPLGIASDTYVLPAKPLAAELSACPVSVRTELLQGLEAKGIPTLGISLGSDTMKNVLELIGSTIAPGNFDVDNFTA